MKTKTVNQDKVNLITLGCSKNLVDSEVILGQLAANDIIVAHEQENDDSNIVIINTCSFISLAKEESINTILQYADYRKTGEIDKLYVTGCLPNRYK
jgi:ribosomal protein S12 methylthiotransferase